MSSLTKLSRGFAPDQQPRKLRAVQPVSKGWQWVLDEGANSGISTETMLTNCRWIEGAEAVEILTEQAIAKAQRVNSYVTQSTKQILNRYEFARQGGWLAYGSTIDGEQAEVPYFKPIAPRIDFEKRKPIKYETPAGCEARPLLPWVTWANGLKIAKRFNLQEEYLERIKEATQTKVETAAARDSQGRLSQRDASVCRSAWGDGVGPTDLMGEFLRISQLATAVDLSFYRWLQCHPEIPILVTEGWKKALALVEQGYPAIALRGVTCWHPKGANELWTELAQFTGPDRQWLIAFDQDVAAKTVKNVSIQISKLGNALQQHGSQVSILNWSPELGKGIDDVLVGLGAGASDWLSAEIAAAPSLDGWKKNERKACYLRVWRYLRSLGIEPERVTEGEYLPELPDLERGAIHVLTAPTGSGKTTRLKKWIDAGYFVLALSPLNSLGKQSAESWGLPHRHDCGNSREQQEAFRLLVYDSGGVVACIDSLARLQEFINDDTPLLLVLDEADQVLESLNLGGTLKSRQGEILELFAQVCQIAARNGAIVLAEATVSRHSLDQIKTLSGIERVRYFQHNAKRQPWPCFLSDGGSVEKFARELVTELGNSKKLILHTSSQNKGEVLDWLVREMLPEKRVIRIDGKTNESGAFNQFFLNPDQFLGNLAELPDLLILSPTAKSGISITIPGFDEVWGLFTCHYPELWAQQLSRYRLPVPRKIFCPTLIPASSADEGYCSTRQVQRQLNTDLAGYQRLAGLAEALDDTDTLDEAEQARIDQIEVSQREFYSAHQTSIGIQKQFARECLTEILESWGHSVTSWQPTGTFGGKILKRIQQDIWLDEAALIAQQQPDFDADEARKRLSSSELTRADRAAAQKVLYQEEFPGISFDDIDDCYLALTENFGRLRRGVLLQARAANLELYKPEAVEQIKAVLNGRIKLPHSLPRNYLRALLIQQTGLLELLDGNPYQESDHRVQTIKTKALQWAGEIYKYFTLSIKPDQTGIEIVNKLLRKLGLTAVVVRQLGKRGEQVRIWGISDLCTKIRVKLLKAATEKLGGDVATIVTDWPESYRTARRTEQPPPTATETADQDEFVCDQEDEAIDYLEEVEEVD